MAIATNADHLSGVPQLQHRVPIEDPNSFLMPWARTFKDTTPKSLLDILDGLFFEWPFIELDVQALVQEFGHCAPMSRAEHSKIGNRGRTSPFEHSRQ